MVQSALNNSILSRLGNRCPQTVFTGRKQSNPISTVLRRHEGTMKVRGMEEVKVKQRLQIEDVQKASDDMHRDFAERKSKSSQRAIDSFHQNVRVKPVNFSEGDFVLLRVMESERVRKPALRWKGPYRVVRYLFEYIFVVEHLLSGKKEQADGRRLKFFRNSSFEVWEELKEHLNSSRRDARR